jgi:protein O-GlcNAc transferase
MDQIRTEGSTVHAPSLERNRAVAQQFFNQGNLAAGEVICRNILDDAPDDAGALHLIGMIAAKIGMREHAAGYLSSALSANPAHRAARDSLNALRALPANERPQRQPLDSKYLVIKSWGFGFWSDVSQVLGALLLAEVTNRIPLVHWGRNSLFGDGSAANAFHNYFELISNVTLQDLARLPGAHCFPPKWTQSNLFEEDINKWQGNYSRAAALYFLARPETIAVCDFFIGVIDVVPWLATDHPVSAEPVIDVYRYLIKKYLRPRRSILDDCESFYGAHLGAGRFVSFHARGSDKTVEDAELERINQSNFVALKTVDITWKIFLMTDDENWVTQVKCTYGDRVITTDCRRTSGKTGLHYLNLNDRVRLGREVMVDVYIARRADKFFGNGGSNVAAFIALLKDWNAGDCILGAPSQLMKRNLFIHVVRR